MEKFKRLISFVLSFAIMLGVVNLPSPAIAKEENNKYVEAEYTIKKVNGSKFKSYKYVDVAGKIPAIKETYRARSAGEAIDSGHCKVKVIWTTFDLKPPKIGIGEVRFYIWDSTTDKLIAQTDPIDGNDPEKVYDFYKTADYDAEGVSHNWSDWELRIPEAVEYDIRLDCAPGGNFRQETVNAIFAQRACPLYKAEYYLNGDTVPKIDAQLNDKNNFKVPLTLNTKNLGELQYNSITNEEDMSFKGKDIEILTKGTVSGDDMVVSEQKGADRWYMEIKGPGMQEFALGKNQSGKFEDAGKNFHFYVEGSHLDAHIAVIREELKVTFDPNGATFDQAVKAEQPIGHSMKIGETFGDLEAVTVPTKDQISNIPQKDNKDQEFVGWVTDVANKDLDFSNGQNADKLVNPQGYEVKDNVTFYAVYAPVAQGRVAVQYVDAQGTAINDKYKIKDEKYPDYAEGNKGKPVEASKIKEPKFIGYKRTADTIADAVKNKTYETDKIQTVEVKYEKLADIIPEKKNGQDNPDVTPDVKEHYAKVTFQVAAADDAKAKLQLDNADATSPLVYYVNPLEGKRIAEVASVKALSKDDNLYKVDANDMWIYNPDTITNTNQVISQATDTQGNVVKTEITLTAKVEDKTAVKFKDKLDPQDIKVWKGDTIDWKKGVKVKDDAENKDQLVADLKTELAKAKAKVEDLGENGTIAEPKTARTSEKQNLPDGKKGNLKVTFDDGSTLVVNEQKLYVSPLKVPVKPGEENQVDPDKLPKDKLAVEFKLGEGVKIGNKESTTTPVLYETYYVKPNTSLESEDIPTTEVLNNNYKNNNWYNGNNVLAEADYTNITTDKTFVAKATPKGQGSAVVEYHVGNENITTKIAVFKIDGQNYPANNKLTGAEDSVIDTSKITQPDLIGYKKVNITTEPATDAKYTEAGTAKVIFNYEKLDDIIGPVKPGDQKPAGYVTVAFKATTGSVLDPGETSYFVNPKADKKAKVSKVGDNYQISGKKADGTDLTGNVPVVNSTDKNKFEIQYADGEAKKWGYDNFNKVGQDLTTDTTFTAQVIKLGEPTVTFQPVEIEKGGSKEVTPEVKDKHGNKVDKPGKPEITETPNGITVTTPNDDGTVKIEVPKDYKGPGEITIKVKYKIGDKEVPGEINVKVKDDKKPEPKPEPQPVPEVEIPGIKIRDHYTPTYPVYVSVPDNGTKVIDTLWYIFHIDKYDYEEVRNNNSTSHKMDVTPVIRNDRTMLPLRYVAEAIGADVKWDPETRTATFTKDGLIATIQIDSDEIVLSNGKTVKMDSKPLNINDRILVSVVNVGNVFGLTNGNTLDGVDQDIEWDHDTRTATIYIRR